MSKISNNSTDGGRPWWARTMSRCRAATPPSFRQSYSRNRWVLLNLEYLKPHFRPFGRYCAHPQCLTKPIISLKQPHHLHSAHRADEIGYLFIIIIALSIFIELYFFSITWRKVTAITRSDRFIKHGWSIPDSSNNSAMIIKFDWWHYRSLPPTPHSSSCRPSTNHRRRRWTSGERRDVWETSSFMPHTPHHTTVSSPLQLSRVLAGEADRTVPRAVLDYGKGSYWLRDSAFVFHNHFHNEGLRKTMQRTEKKNDSYFQNIVFTKKKQQKTAKPKQKNQEFVIAIRDSKG